MDTAALPGAVVNDSKLGRRRGALIGANVHWTKTLSAEHATSRFGARFHLRKLFLRDGVDELSQSELEFIIQYLVNETTIAEQPWWAALTEYERLEVVNTLQLHHVPRGEKHTLWFSSKDVSKDCVLLHGNAEAKPADRNHAPVLYFTEGSVVGNMRLPTTMAASHASATPEQVSSLLPHVAVGVNATAETWRRVKREQAFRNGLHHYNKLNVIGPADYFVLTSSHILETASRAGERVEREQHLRLFGLERFIGSIRKKTFESGSILAKEDELLTSLYFIVEGECRATVCVDEHSDIDPFAEKKLSTTTSLGSALVRGTPSPPRVVQLPIASLGPRALVGDVSMLLGLVEPATVEAVTAVTVLALSYDDFAKDAGDLRDPVAAAPIERMKRVAVETVEFVAERVKAEAAYFQCDMAGKITTLLTSVADKQANQPTQHTESQTIMGVPLSSKSTAVRTPHNQSTTSTVSPQQEKPVSAVLSVVAKYKELVKASSPRSELNLGPIILSKRAHRLNAVPDNDGSLRLTREQRKAAMVLSGLHSPIAAKSLGQLRQDTQKRTRRDEEDDDENEYNRADLAAVHHVEHLSSQHATTASGVDEQLFLVPTMTRQRNLHARSLPLLPRHRGFEGD